MTKHVDSSLRRKTILAGGVASGLIVFGASVAFAVSAALAPGASLPTPSTTAATEPDLSGTVIHDTLVPFTINGPNGRLCSGRLQDRVVKSSKTGQYHFYYRIRNTSGPGAIGRIETASFANQRVDVGYRTDGLGSVPPREASRSPLPGQLINFAFTDPPISCARHQESFFVLIKTEATTFHTGGGTRIFSTTGPAASVATVQP